MKKSVYGPLVSLVLLIGVAFAFSTVADCTKTYFIVLASALGVTLLIDIVGVIGSSPTNPTKGKAPESQVNQGFPGLSFIFLLMVTDSLDVNGNKIGNNAHFMEKLWDKKSPAEAGNPIKAFSLLITSVGRFIAALGFEQLQHLQ